MLRLSLLTAVLVAAVACSSTPPEDYATSLTRTRTEKDENFRVADDSPIPADKRDILLPLSYFPPDENYAVPAALELDANRSKLQMPTSTGTIRDMERVGALKFMLKGQPMQLTAFVGAGERITRLFVPFSDLTSGTETYTAGRYMDIDPTPTGIYIVDFNTAYHPYCYFSAEYECPFPPAENRLKAPIHSGERLPPAR